MIPPVQEIAGEDAYALSVALAMLREAGREVTRRWIYAKTRGLDRSTATYAHAGKSTRYTYKVDPLLIEGRHYHMYKRGRREYIYLTRAGMELLADEYDANQKGETLIESAYTQIDKIRI